MLDQNVPNPLAKNPNFHTHKVFAAIGIILILIVMVIICGGIWYFVQSAEDKAGTADDNTLKVSTPSAKTATKSADTSDWKTYKAPGTLGEFKYPPTLFKGEDFGEGVYYSTFFVSDKSELDVGNNCAKKDTCYTVRFQILSYGDDTSSPYYVDPKDRYPYYNTINGLKIGSTATQNSVSVSAISLGLTREKDVATNGYTWLSFDQEIKNKGATSTDLTYSNNLIYKGNNVYYQFIISSDSKSTVDNEKVLLEKMVSTFKFL